MLRKVNINGVLFIQDTNINHGQVTADQTTVTTESVRLLHNLGHTQEEIMKATGLSKEQMRQVYLRYGVKKPKTPKKAYSA